jgi:hypothetical protein
VCYRRLISVVKAATEGLPLGTTAVKISDDPVTAPAPAPGRWRPHHVFFSRYKARVNIMDKITLFREDAQAIKGMDEDYTIYITYYTLEGTPQKLVCTNSEKNGISWKIETIVSGGGRGGKSSSYKIHTGPKGGKYTIKNGKKMYV